MVSFPHELNGFKFQNTTPFSFRKKSSHDDVKASNPVNPIVVENPITKPTVATPEQKAERKANATKQGAAKKTVAKKAK